MNVLQNSVALMTLRNSHSGLEVGVTQRHELRQQRTQLLEVIQEKFDSLMTGEVSAKQRKGKPKELFEEYASYDSDDYFRAHLLASACEDHVGLDPSPKLLSEAVDMLHDGLNYAHGSLVRQSALMFLESCTYARENLKLTPIEQRYPGWTTSSPRPA